MIEKERKIKECVSYFKDRPVYGRLFQKFREKYAGLGYFGGTAVLAGLGREEKEQLGGFLQKDYADNKTISVSAELMKKSLESSRYAGLKWEEILGEYFGEPLTVKKELKIRKEQEKETYFCELISACLSGRGKKWIQSVLAEQKDGYHLLMQQYREAPERLREIMDSVMTAVRLLPVFSEKKSKVLLPVFSARVTGNPHYFDEGTTAEKLLFDFLKDTLSKERGDGLSVAEYKKKLFYEAGILKDELSNDVLTYGLRAEREDGMLHPGIEGFYQCAEPVKLTLRTLVELGKVYAGNADGEQSKNTVYVVENPAVFSVLADLHPEWAIICGNGQVKLAVLVLMDKLAENSVFYYSGDFDPEGLLIAEKLKNRYKDRLEFWNYSKELYRANMSDVYLDDRRMKKLQKVQAEELREIKEEMERERKAAYQETMMEQWEALSMFRKTD